MLSTTVMVLATFLVLHHEVSAQSERSKQSDGSPCVNSRGMGGVCQKLITCEPLVQLLRQKGNVVAGFMQQSLCFFDGAVPHVCCPNTISNNVTPVTPTSPYGPLLPPVCGTTNASHTRIVGGVPAKLGQWPWIAVLGYRGRVDPNKPRWLCGGSLISSRHVLTAAHCIYQHNDLFVVRIGDLDLTDDNDGATPIDASIEKRTIHPQYNPTYHTNDIGVLRLTVDIKFTPLIRPLCLPVTDSIKQRDLKGVYPFIVGWGSTSFKGTRSSQLQQIQVPIVSQDQCKQAYRNFTTATIDDRVLCAGYAKGGRDACTGDSGGPLMYPIGNNFYTIGVVSYGFKCAEPGYPGIFMKTTSYLDFIISLLN